MQLHGDPRTLDLHARIGQHDFAHHGSELVDQKLTAKLRRGQTNQPKDGPLQVGATDSVQDPQEESPRFGPATEHDVQYRQSVDEDQASTEQVRLL